MTTPNPADPTFALAATRFQTTSVAAAQRVWSFAFEALNVTHIGSFSLG